MVWIANGNLHGIAEKVLRVPRRTSFNVTVREKKQKRVGVSSLFRHIRGVLPACSAFYRSNRTCTVIVRRHVSCRRGDLHIGSQPRCVRDRKPDLIAQSRHFCGAAEVETCAG